MKILLLGASSSIGASIAIKFAEKNELYLLGRSEKKLYNLKNKVIDNGASKVNILNYDLSIKDLTKKFENYKIDLLINVASSTSNYRDDKILLNKMEYDINTDLINPVLLSKVLFDINPSLNIIFISSILSKIYSPNRIIYSSLKNLQESYLRKISDEKNHKPYLLNVFIGTKILKNLESNKSVKLADELYKSFINKEKQMFFGVEGRIIMAIYNFSPFLSKALILLKRKFS